MPAVWNPQANAIFLQVLEQPPAQREAFLQQACGDDAGLAAQVRSLLAASEQAGSFLEAPPTEVQSALVTAREEGMEGLTLDFLSPTQRPDALGRLGHYEILAVVGSGGFGVVLKAFDEQLQRVVAIKALSKSLAASATARRRFVREARAAAAINHENVVHIHAVDETGAVPYLVMEYVAGASLDDKLKASGPPGIKEILRIGMQIASGLAAAHKQGLVHRDVKPANILLENGVERVKITDFGLARTVDDVTLTQTGIIAGTPSFMSPEQAHGAALDHRSDLFSLGSVLYAMCTGRAPFRAETTVATLRRVCDDTPRPIHGINPDIPDWLGAIIDRLLAKKPEERFQTAAEVADLLGQHLAELQRPGRAGGVSLLVAPSHRGTHVPRAPRRLWVLFTALLMFLVIGMGLTEATGVTHFAPTLLRIVTGKGTLLVEVNDPAVKITVEGNGGLVIAGAGLHEVHLKPGQYQLRADKDGQRVPLNQELVTITRGDKQVVRVRLESPATAKPAAAVSASDMKARQELYAGRLGVPVEITNSVGMTLRLVPPGEFLMGTTENEVAEVCKRLEAQGELAFMIDAVHTEHRPRRVVIAEPFYAGACEVTVGQFKRFVSECGYRTGGERANVGGFGDGPGGWERRPEHQWRTPGGWEPSDDQPVVQVSWDDARAFCAWLGKREGRTYTLPTEAQWEYAARAGTTVRYGDGGDLVALDAVGWVRSNRPAARPGPQPVAQKRPNAFGLYDTHGNVWEWCADPFKEADRRRAIRGGTWYLSADHARIGSRGAHEPDVPPDAGTGFRVILVGDLAAINVARSFLRVVQTKEDSPSAHQALNESLYEAGGGSQPGEVAALYREALLVYPKDSRLHFDLGRVHARFGEWDKATAAYARGLELAPNNHDAWFHAAPFYLAAGDQKGFQRHCRQMLDRFGSTNDVVIAERTAITCALTPDVVDPHLLSSLADLAVTKTEQHANYPFFARAKGLAELRAGRPAKAVPWLERFHPTVSDGPWDAAVFAALAMSHHLLGEPNDAQAALTKAKSIVNQHMPKPAKGRPFDAWHDWLHAEILLREAEVLLKKNETTAPIN